MSSSKPSLFSLNIHEDEDGVHIDLSGALAKDLQTLIANCARYCCGNRGCCKPGCCTDTDGKEATADSCCG